MPLPTRLTSRSRSAVLANSAIRLAADEAAVERPGNRLLPLDEGRQVEEWTAEPLAQAPAAHRRLGLVQDAQQRVLDTAGAAVAEDLEVRYRLLVQCHERVRRVCRQAGDLAEGGFLRLAHVGKYRPGGDDGERLAGTAKTVERGGGEMLQQGPRSGVEIESEIVEAGDRRRQFPAGEVGGLGGDDLGGVDAGQLGRRLAGR